MQAVTFNECLQDICEELKINMGEYYLELDTNPESLSHMIEETIE